MLVYMTDFEECSHCGHKWFKRQENPVVCPKCRRRYYGRDKTSQN